MKTVATIAEIEILIMIIMVDVKPTKNMAAVFFSVSS